MSVFLSIVYPVLAISGMGILFGVGLGYAGEVLKVPVDEKAESIREALPGANCGGCGYAGCGAFATAVYKGEAPANGCPVGGQQTNETIAEILGIKAEAFIRKTAYVKCCGSLGKSEDRYDYFGMQNCAASQFLAGGGSKSCKYGCLGNGSCVNACMFGAISMVDGIAVVDEEKCTQCGACIKVCPRDVIGLVPYGESSGVRVECNSRDTGRAVRGMCSVGCISCKLCVKACKYDAVHVKDNIAIIDYETCVQCEECVKKCPAKVIKEFV